MDFKGCRVTEIRTGRIGTIISSDLDHVSVQYDDVRKINCSWSQVKFIDEKNSLSLSKALKRKSRPIASKENLLLGKKKSAPKVNSASQGSKTAVHAVIATGFILFSIPVLTMDKNTIADRIAERFYTKPFRNSQAIIDRINSITKTAEHCARARVYYYSSGREMKRGEEACSDYYDWKENFFPRFHVTRDVFKNDDVYQKLEYIRLLELAD